MPEEPKIREKQPKFSLYSKVCLLYPSGYRDEIKNCFTKRKNYQDLVTAIRVNGGLFEYQTQGFSHLACVWWILESHVGSLEDLLRQRESNKRQEIKRLQDSMVVLEAELQAIMNEAETLGFGNLNGKVEAESSAPDVSLIDL